MSEDETDCGMLALIFIIVPEEILVKDSPTNLIVLPFQGKEQRSNHRRQSGWGRDMGQISLGTRTTQLSLCGNEQCLLHII